MQKSNINYLKFKLDNIRGDYNLEIDQVTLKLEEGKGLDMGVMGVFQRKYIENSIGVKLSLDTALDVLVTENNCIPLWVNIKIIEGKCFFEISSRYRKLHIVKNWHKNNKYAPFKVDENDQTN